MPHGDTIKSYKDLEVWLLAMSLAETCYRATKNFPRDEMYGMTAQIRRASASFPANIAEGYGAIRPVVSSSFSGLHKGRPESWKRI
jgi:23S rRNA-intervening sequence protein